MLEKYPLKMSSKRKCNIDENSENCTDITNNDLIDIFNNDSNSR